MGVLGQLYRLLTVAGPSQGVGPDDRRPVQLRINEARRSLDLAMRDGKPQAQQLKAIIQEMSKELADRNKHAQELEQQDQQDAAMELYEANVSDMFSGSLPYERLITIYLKQGARKEAQRVARACLAHASSGLSDQARALCLSALQDHV